MLLDIVRVELNDNYRLLLTFENGEVKEFDCGSILNDKPYNEIKDLFIFKQVKVENGTVVWPNGIDIAPETLYLESKKICNPLSRDI